MATERRSWYAGTEELYREDSNLYSLPNMDHGSIWLKVSLARWLVRCSEVSVLNLRRNLLIVSTDILQK